MRESGLLSTVSYVNIPGGSIQYTDLKSYRMVDVPWDHSVQVLQNAVAVNWILVSKDYCTQSTVPYREGTSCESHGSFRFFRITCCMPCLLQSKTMGVILDSLVPYVSSTRTTPSSEKDQNVFTDFHRTGIKYGTVLDEILFSRDSFLFSIRNSW